MFSDSSLGLPSRFESAALEQKGQHTMQLFLMQHGQAHITADNPNRPLTPGGSKCIKSSATGLMKLGLRFDVIICSPKTRAKQTAEIVAEVTGYPTDSILETASLKPSAEPEAAVDFISQFRREKSVFAAGHLPSLTHLASYLLTGHETLALQFHNGGLVCIEIEDSNAMDGVLEYILTPSQLACIAE